MIIKSYDEFINENNFLIYVIKGEGSKILYNLIKQYFINNSEYGDMIKNNSFELDDSIVEIDDSVKITLKIDSYGNNVYYISHINYAGYYKHITDDSTILNKILKYLPNNNKLYCYITPTHLGIFNDDKTKMVFKKYFEIDITKYIELNDLINFNNINN